MKLYEEFIKLQQIYSSLTEDKLREGFANDILTEKEMLNSRDIRNIKGAVRSFNITKTSIESKIESIMNNLEFVKEIDKASKILKGFSNLDDEDKEVYEVKKSAAFLLKILSLYRFGITMMIGIKTRDLHGLTETLLGFNYYFSDDVKINDETKNYILSFLSHVNSIPDMAPDYNIDYELFSTKSEISRRYAKKSSITESNIKDLLSKLESLEEYIFNIQNEETTNEVLSIKRRVHPKTIYVSRENLSRLSSSQQTIGNAEILIAELDSIRFADKNGFNARVEEIKSKLISILANQNTLSTDISSQQDEFNKTLEAALSFINNFDESQKVGGQKL